MMTVSEFLQRVEDHLSSTGVAPTRFGITLANDPNFVRDLRSGRVPNLELAGRVIAHIEASERPANTDVASYVSEPAGAAA